jgi:hypothetical protein
MPRVSKDSTAIARGLNRYDAIGISHQGTVNDE